MNILFVMDDIAAINPKKDTTLAMLRATRDFGHSIYICDTVDIWYQSTQDIVLARLTQIVVYDTHQHYYDILGSTTTHLREMDVIIIRKDPPFDMNYIYATYLLEILYQSGVMVVNNPQSLRNFNEKVVLTKFPHLCVPTLITSSLEVIENFRADFDTIILKPLDAMGGSGIYKKDSDELIEKEVIYLTKHHTTPIMAQQFIPEISTGDKRIILIGGKSVPYVLARIPKKGSFKGNLAQGASYEVRKLTQRDTYICDEISYFLQEHGLDFVGIDIIGDYLTEINITSPTGVQEIYKCTGENIALKFMQYILNKL